MWMLSACGWMILYTQRQTNWRVSPSHMETQFSPFIQIWNVGSTDPPHERIGHFLTGDEVMRSEFLPIRIAFSVAFSQLFTLWPSFVSHFLVYSIAPLALSVHLPYVCPLSALFRLTLDLIFLIYSTGYLFKIPGKDVLLGYRFSLQIMCASVWLRVNWLSINQAP